ncbi:MAG: ribonuclease [Gaiellales bacterium]|jgi:ribonuclease D|nr:ribonuclease [Gaiellales bacterium]MDX6545328.1 ribonuclease [Gaiellales bacterium]
MTIEQITDAAGVESLLADARSAGRCALDTEFLWERTYAPVLCLVQIATPQRLAVIDPLMGAPLDAIAALVADPSVRKAMHAPSGDLTGFMLHFGTGAAALFDAQLAAGFAGYGGSLSLERMLDQAIGVRLKHAEGFTDWTKRPLTDQQVAYAADDVRHLLEAMDALELRLLELGRDRWAAEEMERRYGEGAQLVQDPGTAWRRVGGRGKLRGEQLAVLVAVAAWREREARRRDIPTGWLVRDPTLIELARRRPTTVAEAQQVRGLQLKRGPQLDGMLEALAAVDGPPPERAPEMGSELRNRIKVVLPLASAVLQAACADAGIASELVATRDDLESLIRVVSEGDDGDHPLLSGWRRELAGEPLLRLLRGEVSLRVVPGPPHVAEQPSPPAAGGV